MYSGEGGISSLVEEGGCDGRCEAVHERPCGDCTRRGCIAAFVSFIVVMVMVVVVHRVHGMSGGGKRSANVFELASATGGRHLLDRGSYLV